MGKALPPQEGRDAIMRDAFANSGHFANVKQNFIYVTEDRAWRIVKEHQDALQAKHGWVGPLTLTVTLWTTLQATAFREPFLGVPPELVKATYFVAAMFSAGWLVLTVKDAYVTRKNRGVDGVIEKLKGSSVTPQSPGVN